MIDFSRPPYQRYWELLEVLRRSELEGVRVEYRAVEDAMRGTHDANEVTRERVAQMLYLDARPEDLDLARYLLDQEILARQNDSFQGAGDTLTLLSVLLLDYGDASDVERLWAAKTANFDTWAGGYDIEFVFAAARREEVLNRIAATPLGVEPLEKYDLDQVCGEVDRFKAGLTRRYPRELSLWSTSDFEHLADVFDDHANIERLGLSNATSPKDRARVYRRVEKYGEAYGEWRNAASEAESAWDKVSHLTQAMVDAEKAGLSTIVEAEEIDALWSDIEGWEQVGLGRIATQACFALSASMGDRETGGRLMTLAQRWRKELTTFHLLGLRAAVDAAEEWGDASELAELEEALLEEERRLGEATEAT